MSKTYTKLEFLSQILSFYNFYNSPSLYIYANPWIPVSLWVVIGGVLVPETIQNIELYVVMCPVLIQTFDKQHPVILLAIRYGSVDLKHLIPGIGPPEAQG